MAQGEAIEGRLRDDLSYQNYRHSFDGLLSLLTYAGYLTCKPLEGTTERVCRFKIVNREVAQLFHELATKWVSGTHYIKDPQKLLVTYLLSFDLEGFESWLNQAILEGVSFHDYRGQQENFYHALLLGMAILLQPAYRAVSNREVGDGRFDLQLTPECKSHPAYILEIKHTKEVEKEKIQELLNEALSQIKDKRYAAQLKSENYTDIKTVALVFSGKRVWMKGNEPANPLPQ